MNGRFYMILILDKNISQYMQGSALHKHRTLYIAISPCMNTLDHGEILLTCFLQSRLDAKNPWQFAIRIPLVKAEVVLPDRKYAKLWSGMRHEEYADEAPLLMWKSNQTCIPTCSKFYSKFVNVMMGGCKRLLIIKPSYKPWRAWNSNIFAGISQIV